MHLPKERKPQSKEDSIFFSHSHSCEDSAKFLEYVNDHAFNCPEQDMGAADEGGRASEPGDPGIWTCTID